MPLSRLKAHLEGLAEAVFQDDDAIIDAAWRKLVAQPK
jgi:hypothetical protein